jgi:NAD(P)-dependent dehydrogenase (short-subunit alcohol dehydrogenase family)
MAEEGGTVIVTGAAGGLGRSIAEQYIKLTKPYDAQFTVRNAAHANAAPLRQLLGDDPRFSTPELALDSLAAVRQFTSKLNTDIAAGRAKPIRALVLNAAVQSTIGVRYTSDGLEESFAVNYLANFLLVLLLLQSMDKDHGRIVFVSSFSHDSALSINQGHAPEKLAWKDPEELAKPTTKDAKGDEWAAGMRRYAASKLWLLMFTYASDRFGCSRLLTRLQV